MQTISIFVGTVYGKARQVANTLKEAIEDKNWPVEVFETPSITDITKHHGLIIVCTSTTGMGELPHNLRQFHYEIEDKRPMQTGRKFVVIGLGDSSYENYCQAGKTMEEALRSIAAMPLLPRLDIDAAKTSDPQCALKDWLPELFASLDTL